MTGRAGAGLAGTWALDDEEEEEDGIGAGGGTCAAGEPQLLANEGVETMEAAVETDETTCAGAGAATRAGTGATICAETTGGGGDEMEGAADAATCPVDDVLDRLRFEFVDGSGM